MGERPAFIHALTRADADMLLLGHDYFRDA